MLGRLFLPRKFFTTKFTIFLFFLQVIIPVELRARVPRVRLVKNVRTPSAPLMIVIPDSTHTVNKASVSIVRQEWNALTLRELE